MNRRYMKKCIKRHLKDGMKWAINNNDKKYYDTYKKALMGKHYVVKFESSYIIFFYWKNIGKQFKWTVTKNYFCRRR